MSVGWCAVRPEPVVCVGPGELSVVCVSAERATGLGPWGGVGWRAQSDGVCVCRVRGAPPLFHTAGVQVVLSMQRLRVFVLCLGWFCRFVWQV